MIYEDITKTLEELNTGSTVPDGVAFLTKLVCGKVARRRLPSLVRLAEISTSGSTSLNLRTLLPDFLDFKLDPENDNKVIYSLDSDNNPTFFKLVSSSSFVNNAMGGYAKKEGNTLTISVDPGATVPTKIYFPYYSFFCFADENTGVPKETPVTSGDICLLPGAFDDVIIEGILLYISRREKENSEYTKNVQEWEKRVNEIIFYS